MFQDVALHTYSLTFLIRRFIRVLGGVARIVPSEVKIGGTRKVMITRVTMPGDMCTVSFQPRSVAPGGRTGPVKMNRRKGRHVEELTVDNLDVHEVEVHRVHVLGRVEDLSDLGRSVVDHFGGRIGVRRAIGAPALPRI